MQTVRALGPALGVAPLCAALGLPRATYYRGRQPKATALRRRSHRALVAAERGAVLEVLHAPRFADLAPAQVYASLLDEGSYLCSLRTMYRVLAECREVRERRDHLRHPHYAAPELLATGPNQVWSWDITKLLGPAKWTYFYLYVILDIFSRYVVGWMAAYRESKILAKRLITKSCERQGIRPGQLSIHADRGSAMTSRPVALLMSDLGITKTHSRPHVSNDNPYSEAHFRTMKYRPGVPERFGSLQQVLGAFGDLFSWYNGEHHHVGLGLLTPHDVHYGLAHEKIERRATVLATAYAAHPERFPHGLPRPPQLPKEVWINKPATTQEDRITAVAVAPGKTDAPGCPRIADLNLGRGRAIPESAGVELATTVL